MSIRKYAALTVLDWEVGGDRPLGIIKEAHRANFDHIERKKGFLYVRCRAISSRINENFDGFSREAILGESPDSGWQTFIGKPVFVNHHNDDHRIARGVILDAVLHDDLNPDGTPDAWVEVLHEIDAMRFPKLAQAIISGRSDRTSMGCFIPGTPVTCADGSQKPIESFVVGDEVMTHKGATGKVGYVMERPYEGVVYDIATYGQSANLVLTPEHPVWIRKTELTANQASRKGVAKTEVCVCGLDFGTSRSLAAHVRESKCRSWPGEHRSDPRASTGWVEARDVQSGDWVLTPTPVGVGHPGSYPFARLLGYYLAEGNLGWDRKRSQNEPITVVRCGYAMVPSTFQHSPSTIAIGGVPKYVNQAVLERPEKNAIGGKWGSDDLCYTDEVGCWRKVMGITIKQYVGNVYNLAVPGDHSYIAADVAVHNCDVAYSICSACGNRAENTSHFCEHVPSQKGMKYRRFNAATGKVDQHKIYEDCHRVSYFENSHLVEPPADPTAICLDVDSSHMSPSGIEHTAAKESWDHEATQYTAARPKWGPGHPGYEEELSYGTDKDREIAKAVQPRIYGDEHKQFPVKPEHLKDNEVWVSKNRHLLDNGWHEHDDFPLSSDHEENAEDHAKDLGILRPDDKSYQDRTHHQQQWIDHHAGSGYRNAIEDWKYAHGHGEDHEGARHTAARPRMPAGASSPSSTST